MGDWKRLIFLVSVMSTWLGLSSMYLFIEFIQMKNFPVSIAFFVLTLLMLDPIITFIGDRAIDFWEALITMAFGSLLAYFTVQYVISKAIMPLILNFLRG